MIELRYKNHPIWRYGEKSFFTIGLISWEKIFTIGNFHRWKIHPLSLSLVLSPLLPPAHTILINIKCSLCEGESAFHVKAKP